MTTTAPKLHESCLDRKGTAALLCLTPRSLDKRHTWNPEFPRPILRRPLIWRRTDIEQWIVDASRRVNR